MNQSKTERHGNPETFLRQAEVCGCFSPCASACDLTTVPLNPDSDANSLREQEILGQIESCGSLESARQQIEVLAQTADPRVGYRVASLIAASWALSLLTLLSFVTVTIQYQRHEGRDARND